MSGKTFYIETWSQIDHLINLFEKGFNRESVIEDKPANTFVYLKYILLNCGSMGQKLIAVMQLKKRNSTEGVVCNSFWSFKNRSYYEVSKSINIPTYCL